MRGQTGLPIQEWDEGEAAAARSNGSCYGPTPIAISLRHQSSLDAETATPVRLRTLEDSPSNKPR
jgi:hypothetical protein